MNKPPVLNDEEINKWCEEHRAGKGGICYVANSCDVCKRTIQRDADVEWYKGRVKRGLLAFDVDTLLNPEHPIYKRLAELVVSMSDKICQETAREIFEEMLNWVIERRLDLQAIKVDYESSRPKEVQAMQVLGSKIKAFQEMINKLQSLKDKYLKGEK